MTRNGLLPIWLSSVYIETFVSLEVLNRQALWGSDCPSGRNHAAFVDPSGGDSMTLAVAHAEGTDRP